MKPVILTVVLLLTFVSASLAQNKVEKFCEIIAAAKGFSGNKWLIRLRSWEADSLFSFKDSAVLFNLKKVDLFSTVPDMINYMSGLGWRPVTFLVDRGLHEFYFKKEFDPAELAGGH